MVEYTQIVASTKGSFKSLTAGAPAAETWEGRKDVKVATLRQEGPSSADRWHQVAEDLLLGFDQNCTFFPSDFLYGGTCHKSFPIKLESDLKREECITTILQC